MTIDDAYKIGTLGKDAEDVTCSILATKSLGNRISIVAFGEFEFAAKSLLDNNIDAMVVPGAYPKIGKFIMDERLIVKDVFTYVIPELVFASEYEICEEQYDILYNHPATDPLLSDIHYAKWNIQENVSSNTIACLSVLKSAKKACAVTNSACADKYGLYVHQIIRKGINMPFVIFSKK